MPRLRLRVRSRRAGNAANVAPVSEHIPDRMRDEGEKQDFYPPSQRLGVIPVATLSVAAAAIHFSVVPEHVVEYVPFGILFLGLGWFQAFWALAYVRRPEQRLNVAAIVVNVAAVVVWLLSRTVGLPFGPEPFTPEEFAGADVVATVEEVMLVGLLLLRTMRPPPVPVDRRQSEWLLVAVWCAFIVLVTSTVLLAQASHVH